MRRPGHHRAFKAINVVALTLLHGSGRHARLGNGKLTFLALLLVVDLGGRFGMQIPHQTHDVASSVITQQSLVKQTILVSIVQLQPPALLAAQDSSECLVDYSLRPDGQVLFVVVVMRDYMVCAFE